MLHTHTLETGMRVRSGHRAGIIVKIHGDQMPANIRPLLGLAIMTGGRASVDVIWEDGAISYQIPEAIARTWEALDGMADEDEINAAFAAAVDRKAADDAKAQRLQEACDTERARILAAYAWLEPATKGGKRWGATLAAENIRRELKRAFPGIKFSVRSSVYSGGDSIRIGWTDGPTQAAVETIADKYEAGRFDGMDDSYTYRRGLDAIWGEIFGDAQYVFADRSFSDKAIAWALDHIVQSWGLPTGGQEISPEAFKGGRLSSVCPARHCEDFQRLTREALNVDAAAFCSQAAESEPQAMPATWQINEAKGGVEILFPTAPAPEVREALKAAGFRWSQAAGLWWSKRSEDAEAIARQLVAHVCLCGA